MFQKACSDIRGVLIPIVDCWRNSAGGLGYSIGAGVMINEQGWFVTAAHILMFSKEIESSVNNKTNLPKLGQITNHACVIGSPKARLSYATIFSEIDLGIAKLTNYTHPPGLTYPKLRVNDVQRGELLCRIGFPFVDNIDLKWHNAKFHLPNFFPVPPFVNEALVSRFVKLKEGTWIETSSPGLLGQSGGPLLDENGLICGIQVNTKHYPLNFHGSGQKQFFNVGRAVHVETIRRCLDNTNTQYHTG